MVDGGHDGEVERHAEEGWAWTAGPPEGRRGLSAGKGRGEGTGEGEKGTEGMDWPGLRLEVEVEALNSVGGQGKPARDGAKCGVADLTRSVRGLFCVHNAEALAQVS